LRRRLLCSIGRSPSKPPIFQENAADEKNTSGNRRKRTKKTKKMIQGILRKKTHHKKTDFKPPTSTGNQTAATSLAGTWASLAGTWGNALLILRAGCAVQLLA